MAPEYVSLGMAGLLWDTDYLSYGPRPVQVECDSCGSVIRLFFRLH
jgi:hypothetical protein